MKEKEDLGVLVSTDGSHTKNVQKKEEQGPRNNQPNNANIGVNIFWKILF